MTTTGAAAPHKPPASRPDAVLATTRWGSGPTAVLVHGGGAGGAAGFHRQQPLAENFTLVLPDRPGAGRTPADGPQNAVRDARLVAEQLLTEQVHLVAHSYGALVAMVTATLRPDHVRSLVLIEPPVFQLAADIPAVDTYWRRLRDAIADPDPRQRVSRFLSVAGITGDLPPGPLPPHLRQLAEDLPAMQQPWDVPVDLALLRCLPVPKLIVSGAHHDAVEHLADRLAALVGGEHTVLPGAGHAVQDIGEQFNTLLRGVWT